MPLRLALLSLLLGLPALAGERTLTWTYDSGVLPPGSKELEPWSTARFGRPSGFTAFDNRVELELGVVPAVQTSLYLNFSTAREGGVDVQEWSLSNEWKWKLLDPVADAFGFALYGEATLGVKEEELEAKLIFDKRIGKLLLALNLVGALNWEADAGHWTHGQEFEASAGVEYAVGAGFHLGVESRVNCLWQSGPGFLGGAVFVGPVLSFVQPTWWLALSFLPQAAGFGGSSAQTGLELTQYERFNVRLLAGFDL
jgi:hypothetical protein